MSTTSYGRSRSGDRFYYPPQVRRQLQLQQQQQQQLLSQKQEREEIRRQKNQQQQQRRHHKPAAQQRVQVPESSENQRESNDYASTATTAPLASVSNLTNLDRFLEYTTPLVPAQHFSKVRPFELDHSHCFAMYFFYFLGGFFFVDYRVKFIFLNCVWINVM